MGEYRRQCVLCMKGLKATDMKPRSLVHPSAQLGTYTLKSTPGLMSRYGIVTGSYWHDTPGPLARSMRDVATLLDIMAGVDSKDNLTAEAPGHMPEKGYTAEITDKAALKGMKLGLPWDNYWAANRVRHLPLSPRSELPLGV